MSAERTTQGSQASTPDCGQPSDGRSRRSFSRWRAFSLVMVYVLMAVHIIHWRVTGKTLAPLELNEVMYTLELGIITAGFLFMCFLVLGSAIFGRFFCSWGCHIMGPQDLCAWILGKLGIRRKVIRSRLLLLVPPLTAAYMFLWPQIVRAWRNKALPEFHLRTDEEGLASFATDNFWRNLPGPWIIALTFLVCGFVIVYLLGTRAFCTYVCPYGAIFGLADRFAPGRIRVNDACVQCGSCTATCTSGVRVHEEVEKHGMIVNPACMKDLDCLAGCPQNALHYEFGRPALHRSLKSGGRFGLPYDLSLGEDILAGAVALFVLLTFRGLYGQMPFLLSIALGGVVAYLALLSLRLVTRADVVLSTSPLKSSGQLTPAGRAYVVFAAALAVFVAHSAFVRLHEFRGVNKAIVLERTPDPQTAHALAAGADADLLAADRWGLLGNRWVERGLVSTSLHAERFDDAQRYARRLLARSETDVWARLHLGKSLRAGGRGAEAEQAFRTIIAQCKASDKAPPPELAAAHHELAGLLTEHREFGAAAREMTAAIALDPSEPRLHAELGSLLAEAGQADRAESSLNEALRLDPRLGIAHYNFGRLRESQGRFAEAVEHYQRAVEAEPNDAGAHNNMASALMQLQRLDEARKHFERAIEINPRHARAHFNLGTLLASQKQLDRARHHYTIAARLDPQCAALLRGQPRPQ